ncbi:MAG: hypothetical protein RIG61_01650 [Deltaproteobacteria bacterium]
MFQKLRSDLFLKFSQIKLVLVNADGFVTDGPESANGSFINGNHIEELREYDVELIAFSETKSQTVSSVAEKLGIVLHQGISEKSLFYTKIKEEYSVSDNEIALICRDDADLPLVRKVIFSAVTPEAPLPVKAQAYFATYSAGSGAVGEIAALIVKAKKYPGGWSE